MLKYIKRSDIFGETISFTINKEDSAKTFLGGIITIILYTVSIIFFGFSAQDSLIKQNPTFSSYTNVKKERDPIILNNKTMPFAIGIIDDNGNNYNKYVRFNIHHFSLYFANGTVIYNSGPPIKLVECNLNHFPNITLEEFYGRNLTNYKCVDDLNVTLSGYWNEVRLNGLNLSVTLCNEDEPIETCNENRNKLREIRRDVRNMFLA